jgi:hypothetical protein
MPEDFNQDIGYIKATMEHQSGLIEELRNDMKEMKANWAEVKGGWKVILVVAAFVGAIVTQAVSWGFKHF